MDLLGDRPASSSRDLRGGSTLLNTDLPPINRTGPKEQNLRNQEEARCARASTRMAALMVALVLELVLHQRQPHAQA
jgi:hypothetical protein